MHLAGTARFLYEVAAATLPNRERKPRLTALPLDSLSRWTSTAYSSFVPVNGTYSALVQNGAIELLRSDSLRLRIIEYAAVVAAVQEAAAHGGAAAASSGPARQAE